MIHHQHNVAGIVDNRAFGADFVIIKLQQRTVAVDAADPQNAEIEAELRDKVERRLTDNSTVAATQFATCQNDAEIFFLHQRIGHVQVVRHDAQIFMVEQRMRHRFWRGPDIDKQRCAVRNLACHFMGNALFLGRLRRFTVVP